jgi:isopenicillin-N N-acyltransferase-like protein
VIFKPAKLQVWISTNPFQLGQYVCYDLNKVFAAAPNLKQDSELYEKQLTIPADSFLYSQEFKKFNAYKQMRNVFKFIQKHELSYPIDEKLISNFINCNPEYFETYVLLGKYFYSQGNTNKAVEYLTIANSKEITTEQDKEEIHNLFVQFK